MQKLLFFIVGLFLSAITSCSKTDRQSSSESHMYHRTHWLVSPDEIVNTDHSRDFIPSIDNPAFIDLQESEFQEDDLMLVYSIAGQVRIYPHPIMRNHEIVNDRSGDHFFAVTYCPITGSGINWNRKIKGDITEFGVSGLLYRDNIVPYDRNTESYWSQMRMLCIHGELMGEIPQIKPLLETRYATVISAFPNARVLKGERQNVMDHFDIHKSISNLEPVEFNDIELLPGKRYFGIIDGLNSLVFDYDFFTDSIKVYTTTFNNKKIIIVGSNAFYFMAAFYVHNNASNPVFEAVQGQLPVVLKDNKGNRYDIFGSVIDGPDKGFQLTSPIGFVAYGFAWPSFYPGITLFEPED